MENGGIYIGNIGGDAIGVSVTGSDNVIGKNISINEQLENIPKEYADSLKAIMEQIKNYNIPPEQIKPIQDGLNDLTKEVEGIKPEEKVSTVKEKALNTKYSIFVEKVLKVLPKTAETVATFTPLAPFSKLIGEGVEQLVQTIQKDV